jgi:GAF domain-containing protein
MVVPIVLDDVLVGVINVSTDSSAVNYDSDEFQALQAFAQNIGACIRHAQKLDNMKQRIQELEDLTKAEPLLDTI